MGRRIASSSSAAAACVAAGLTLRLTRKAYRQK
jgi:hypothetical protein